MNRLAYRNVLVIVKQTPYEQYLQLKNQGKAPIALRWNRLKERYEGHRRCVDNVVEILKREGCNLKVISREEMHRGQLQDKDLVIAVGGDGTVLNSASFLSDKIPLLGVNSDPTRASETSVTKVVDERRSKGALCAATALNVHECLPLYLSGNIPPQIRTRIKCVVKSTYTETKLPPALNDILIAHPTPAVVSRFRLRLLHDCSVDLSNVTGQMPPCAMSLNSEDIEKLEQIFSFNTWCSGMWICTATGSTAAMRNAGGREMNLRSRSLQYLVREHMAEPGQEHLRAAGHGMIGPADILMARWNSQKGSIFVDGSHMEHHLELGDEIYVTSNAPHLNLFESLPDENPKPVKSPQSDARLVD